MCDQWQAREKILTWRAREIQNWYTRKGKRRITNRPGKRGKILQRHTREELNAAFFTLLPSLARNWLKKDNSLGSDWLENIAWLQ